jgi:hypothetical protein
VLVTITTWAIASSSMVKGGKLAVQRRHGKVAIVPEQHAKAE